MRWLVVKQGSGQILCGNNQSRDTYSALYGNQVFAGDVNATFDVMFKNFARNQEDMVSINASGGKNTFDGVFFQSDGTIELTRIKNGVADLEGIQATSSSVIEANRWYTFRLERSEQTLSLFREDDETPLLSRAVAKPLPAGVIAFAIRNYDVSDDPNITMCIDNLSMTEL